MLKVLAYIQKSELIVHLIALSTIKIIITITLNINVLNSTSTKNVIIIYLLFIINESNLCLLSKYLLPTFVLNIVSFS